MDKRNGVIVFDIDSGKWRPANKEELEKLFNGIPIPGSKVIERPMAPPVEQDPNDFIQHLVFRRNYRHSLDHPNESNRPSK